jgi:hypothetical protein
VEHCTALQQHRQTAVLGVDVRTHQAQWRRHSFHRAAHQRGITNQGAGEGLPCQQTHEQADCRAGIAQVQWRGTGTQTRRTRAVDQDFAGPALFDTHTQRTQRPHGRQAVGTVEKSLDMCRAGADATEHQRTV